MGKPNIQRIIFILLLVLGAGIRVFGAWCYRGNFHPDAGIVALMTRHMAEGRDFPVFYYGQPYMGSLEPIVGALFCRLFGCSGFVVCLGTAFFGFLLLPVVYVWARDAAGKSAGIAAMAFCLVGTGGYFHYLGSTRGGGYAATLFLGIFLLWLSGRIIFRELHDNRQHWGWFFLLGLAAGLGWWTNQLIFSALVTCTVVFALLLRRKVFTWRLTAGGAGFFLGSLPFWVWNARNNWATFSFADTFKGTESLHAMSVFLPERLSKLLDLGCLLPTERVIAITFYSGAVLIVLITVIVGVLRRRETREHIHVFVVLLFVLISSLVFSASDLARLDKPTYILPLFPAIAVIIGIATARLARWLPYGLGWIPVVLLIVSQCSIVLPGNFALGKECRFHIKATQDFGDFLRERDIEAVYTPYYGVYSRNFLLGEEFCLTDLVDERYPPYSERAESAANVAVIRNYGDLEAFLSYGGGSARTDNILGMSIHYDLLPPEGSLKEIHPEDWTGLQNATGEGLVEPLTDHKLDTCFAHGSEWRTDEYITVGFKKPVVVSAVRLMNPRGDFPYPPIWGIEGKRSDSVPWQTIMKLQPSTGYFWSGIRLYWGGIHHRAMLRFEPRMLSALRILLPHDYRSPAWQIFELQLFGPGADREPEPAALPKLTEVLKTRGIDHLYSDRWVANAVHRELAGRVLTEREPLIQEYFGRSDQRPAGKTVWFYLRRRKERNPENVVEFAPRTALLTLREDARLCRDVLAQRRVVMRETSIEPWVLFDFGPGQWREEYRDDLGLYWAGFSCLLSDKRWAATLIKRAERAYSRDASSPEVELLLEETLRKYPNYKYAADKLAAVHSERGHSEKAARLESWSWEMWQPEIPAEILFRNGAKFLGVSVEPQRVHAGGELTVRYYWKCPTKVQNELLAVFVHIKGRKDIFQDDHVFLRGFDVARQPYPEIFIEERKVHVPEHIAAGPYDIWLGLCRRDPKGKRVKLRTRLPVHSRSVQMPFELEVAPEGRTL